MSYSFNFSASSSRFDVLLDGFMTGLSTLTPYGIKEAHKEALIELGALSSYASQSDTEYKKMVREFESLWAKHVLKITMTTSIQCYKNQSFVEVLYVDNDYSTIFSSVAFDTYEKAEAFEAKVLRFFPSSEELGASAKWQCLGVIPSYELQCSQHATGALDMDREC